MSTSGQATSHQVLSEDVEQAIQGFAQALAETPVFQAWEQAAWALRQDETAQTTFQQLATLDRQLRPLIMLGALDIGQRQQLLQLRDTYFNMPVVAAYGRAEDELRTLCQEANAAVAAAAGLDLTAWCGSGCCG